MYHRRYFCPPMLLVHGSAPPHSPRLFRFRYALECNPRVCNGCWAQGLGSYATSGAEALRTRCFMTGCSLVVPPSAFKKVST